MKTGRPPKPKAVHILEGTFRKDRHGEDGDAVQADGNPVCPKSLTGNARKFWQAVVPGLIASGVAKAVDTPALVALCRWHVRYEKYSRALDRKGAGNEAVADLFSLAQRAWHEFDRLASRFGLTPADRQRLRLVDQTKKAGVMSRQRNA